MSKSAHQHTHTLPPQVFPQHPITAGGFRAVPRSGRQRHVATQCRVGDADAVDVVPSEAPGAPHHIAVHAFSRGRTALEGAEGETAPASPRSQRRHTSRLSAADELWRTGSRSCIKCLLACRSEKRRRLRHHLSRHHRCHRATRCRYAPSAVTRR